MMSLNWESAKSRRTTLREFFEIYGPRYLEKTTEAEIAAHETETVRCQQGDQKMKHS